MQAPEMILGGKSEKVDLIGSSPFVFINVVGIVGLVAYTYSWCLFGVLWLLKVGLGVEYLAGYQPLSWIYGAVIVVRYLFHMFLVTGVRHRYFSHRTYKTSRWFQALLAFLATGDLQKGILWWAAHHRIHHKHSDKPNDPHTTLYRASKWQGVWWAHAGWILCGKYNDTDLRQVPDLAKFPELRFLNKPYGYLIMPVLSAVVLAYSGLLLGGLTGATWMLVLGFFGSTTLLYHGTFSINSVAHLVGTQAYDTGDQSRNNWWLAIITLGEGWHNNHHADEYCERQGRKWWQIDISHYVIVLLSWLRLVWNIRGPRSYKVASV